MSAISPRRDEDFSQWYLMAVMPLAQHGAVRGTQVIKPWGYGIWSFIKSDLDLRIQKKGCENFYAPLFVGLDALSQEAAHIEGFAAECAVVTHSRLSLKNGVLVPDSPLTEPVVVRPTSEAIIGPIAKGWVESYRDLPLKLNQWANVVRWEMRTRLFLRSSEFLWQEGHTFHATENEANDFAKQMWHVYAEFMKETLALPVVMGEKPMYERFSGAKHSYTLELLMQDGKALQGGTSHDLGQNFSKAYDISFMGQDSQIEHACGTSWGLTTRLIGAMVMVHGDDDGLRIPPKVALKQVVIIPINPKNDLMIEKACVDVQNRLAALMYDNKPVRVTMDNRDIRGGAKKWAWVKKGIPLRIEIGPRDLEKQSMCVIRRDMDEKQFIPMLDVEKIPQILEDIQDNLYHEASDFLRLNTHVEESLESLLAYFEKGGIGLVKVPYFDHTEVEETLSQHQISVRCIQDCAKSSICVFTGKATQQVAIIAKSY
jgi:prolyl-tRNA synthetase